MSRRGWRKHFRRNNYGNMSKSARRANMRAWRRYASRTNKFKKF